MRFWRALNANHYALDADFGSVSDDLVLVFHRQSGETHLLNFLSSAVFAALQSGPVSERELVARVRMALSDVAAEIAAKVILQALTELDHAGLALMCDGSIGA